MSHSIVIHVDQNGWPANTRMTPHYRQSFLVALTGHFVLISAAVVISVLPGCFRPKPVDLSPYDKIDINLVHDFTKLSRPKPPPEHVAQPPPAPPTEVPEPATPPDPVPVRPAPTPTPVPKVQVHDAEGARPKERTPPHDPKPVASNATHTAVGPVPVVRSNIRATHIVAAHGPQRPAPLRPIKAGDLGESDPLNGLKAPLGDSYAVPLEEKMQCLLRIKRALYDVWVQPTLADAGRQAAQLEIRFDANGRVIGASLAQSSGSEVMDRSVLQAARSVTRVEGLTSNFMRDYPKPTVDFSVTE